ncbi:heat-inducible transcriptional repressor HrcA [Haloplasma contractile]|uniref:Heat-inducible transcription repressor HrcA n=1 Tax=Haloplasma contractile SSD-17B TaxID=1033810 RepID=U2FLP0_9MOLU|nr:heat-inducible transcriptional repressor HrcA [Haloplasma contractile]ERJ13670.1 Heat-inducible transcription repressor HrcA protein [Haloplasma contractile SSD-17B]
MLTERQMRILLTIVEEFVRTAEPLGSRTLSKMDHLPYSSATIRNEMADLEELGFLEKPHTSSGRVPSEAGYRFYVEHIQSNASETDFGYEFQPLEQIFTKKDLEREEAIQEAVKLLSEITNYTSIILGPSAYKCRVKKFQFVPLDSTHAVLLLVTDKGHVESKNIVLPKGVNIKEVEKVVTLMNDTLVDCYVSDIPERLNFELKPYFKQFIDYQEGLIESFLKAFSTVQEHFYLSGQSNIFRQPEFHDIEKVKKLLTAFEDKQILKVLPTSTQGLTVSIGHENRLDAMQNCSIITVPYKISDNDYGQIAIVGPTRMEYSKVIPLLEYLAKNMSKLYK